MTSSFDPTQFLDATTTEASTRRPPITVGDYPATLGEPDVRQVQGKKDPSKNYVFVDFPVIVDLSANPSEAARVGTDSVRLRYSVSLDFNEGGAMDWSAGRNNGLRFLREATGTNVAGKAFSIRALEGRSLKVRIKHVEYPEGSGEMVDQIESVSKP